MHHKSQLLKDSYKAEMHFLLIVLSANSVFIRQGLTSIVTNYVNGVLSCSFERAIAADTTQKRFDLNKAYTLFYATGPGLSLIHISEPTRR